MHVNIRDSEKWSGVRDTDYLNWKPCKHLKVKPDNYGKFVFGIQEIQSNIRGKQADFLLYHRTL